MEDTCCDGLDEAVKAGIIKMREDEAPVAVFLGKDGKPNEQEIEYCPFCGESIF